MLVHAYSTPSSSLLFPSAQFEGEELVDQHRETLDLLLAQTDHFLEGSWFRLKPKRPNGEKELGEDSG